MKIFHLDCSVNNIVTSVTRKKSKKIVDMIAKKHSGTQIHYIDLIKENIPFMTKEYERAMFKTEHERTLADRAALSVFNLKPFVEADVYVLGIPAYFFNVPAIFKNWLEHVFRIDTTISSDWEGMLKNKKMYIVSAWGSVYANTTIEHTFEQVIYQTFNLFGITDITFFNIYRDEETNSDNIEAINDEIERLFS